VTSQNATATRVGPVHFQSLERELRPVAGYLSGHMLNAGCGSRDITAYLLANAVTKVTKYDIASQDPEVVVGPLESLPFADGTFDSVLCNAVLEHVSDAEGSMRELARVVRPDGHVVVAVPFLQPFHACPADFRRYTADGLGDLGRRAGLEVVCVLPVHSIAQTLGWILWEYAQEKGGRIRRALAWAVAFAATRLWNRTDTTLVRNANTFQAVFRRRPRDPQASASEWRQRGVPAACAGVPTMLVPDELRLLHYLAEERYTGEGAVVDAGCFLGGSTLALADGLRRNLRRRGVEEEKLIHSYDRFEIEGWTIGSFFPKSAQAGESFRPLFDRNVAPYAGLVEVHPGDMRRWPWQGGPVELLFIDVAKHWTVCDWVTWQFFPRLIPGKSLVIQQDYLYHHWVAWIHVTMEFYSEYFEYVCDTGVNSVVFLNTKRIPEGVLREKTVESLTTAEKCELMDRAAARFKGGQAKLLRSAKQHFLEVLGES
jgi:SAM-dependent methyltransferase